MLDNQTESQTIEPLFSIIIPMEFHRGQWELCWQGWQSQTIARAAFEIILVVPPGFPERDRLSELAGALTRVEYSQHTHDIDLCAVGAASARGQFLFFTESHCWPEPDMLELCLRAIHANPDWAGFSCKSIRVTHNRLSEVEADMYEADTEYGMTVHPWRKILDACFVTRREAYEAVGGFKPEFGHFSEWALAASYFESGRKIGYLPEALIHHYYIGSLAVLATFTLDFVEGEIRYFGQDWRRPGSLLFEAPPELICQDNFDHDMARGILRMTLHDIRSSVADGMWRPEIFLIGRWASPAIFGDGIARGAAATVLLNAHFAVMLASVAGTRRWLGACFKRYMDALIRYQRLNCIRAERLSKAAEIRNAMTATVLNETGFYPVEKYQGSPFRWSETAAAVRVRADAGRHSVCVKCVPLRKLSETDLRFYLDGKRIPNDAILMGVYDFEIRIDLPQSGTCKLGWVCRPFQATDPRRLGLPIMRVELASHNSTQ